jgi:hypothetical protein
MKFRVLRLAADQWIWRIETDAGVVLIDPSVGPILDSGETRRLFTNGGDAATAVDTVKATLGALGALDVDIDANP